MTVTNSKTASAETRAAAMFLLAHIHEDLKHYELAISNYIKMANFYSGVPKLAAEGLWRGANLLERQAKGEIPMPTPTPKPVAAPKAPVKPAGKPTTASK